MGVGTGVVEGDGEGVVPPQPASVKASAVEAATEATALIAPRAEGMRAQTGKRQH